MEMDIQTRAIRFLMIIPNGKIEMVIHKIVFDIFSNLISGMFFHTIILNAKILMGMVMVITLQEIMEMHSNLTQHNGLTLMETVSEIITELAR